MTKAKDQSKAKDAPVKKPKLCGAAKKGGGKCARAAGWGTDHVGFGRCKSHIGSTRNGKIAAAKEEAVETAMLLLGAAPNISPHDAILQCLHSAWGEWHFYEHQIASITLDEVIVRPLAETAAGKNGVVRDLQGREEINLWIHMRNVARDKAARFAEMAARMGVEERRVQLAEDFGKTIGRLITGILGDLKLTPAQKKIEAAVVTKHLVLLDGGAA